MVIKLPDNLPVNPIPYAGRRGGGKGRFCQPNFKDASTASNLLHFPEI